MHIRILSGRVFINDVNEFVKRLQEISAKYEISAQAFDAMKIAGRHHLELAVKKALNSVEGGRNISRDPSMEALLYASGRRHISKAIEMGAREGENKLAVMFFGNNVGNLKTAEPEMKQLFDELDESLLELTPDKRSCIMGFYNITDEELKVSGEDKLADLVNERVVLLELSK